MEECIMVNVFGTDAVEFIQEKLGFVESFSEGDVEVRIKNTKGSDLRLATITYRLKGHPRPTHIETKEHRSVAKCILELADTVSVKIAKDQDKYASKNRKRRRRLEEDRLKEIEKEMSEKNEIEISL